MRSSRGSATGVGALLKKANVRSLRGRATIVDGKTAIVHADTGEQRIHCEHLVIATGSEPVGARRAAVRRRRPVFDRGAGADEGSGVARRRRRRLYRHGARHGLRQARREGDDRRGAAEDPAALRRGADPAGRAPPRRSRRRDDARRAGAGLRRRRAQGRRRGRRRERRLRRTRSWSRSGGARARPASGSKTSI